MSSDNQVRDTPGRLLLGWGVLLSSLVLLSWRIHLHQAEYDWVEYPTALGDRAYYEVGPSGEIENWVRNGPGRALGEVDFYQPNLKFELEGKSFELFRRMHQPTPRDDARMRKVAMDRTGQFYIYTDSKTKDGVASRYYLKAAEDGFIEFGEKKFFQTYEETLNPKSDAAAPPS